MSSNVLQICPYKPPMSGWVRRVSLLRRTIEENGGVCEILDIGPSRKLEGRDCIPVHNGWDYLLKVLRFVYRRFTVHCHINGEYFRGLLLALVACTISRLFGNRCLVTFHAGTDQPFLQGWRKAVIGKLYRLIFSMVHVVICNSEAVKIKLQAFQKGTKIAVIPAFSPQYLDFSNTILALELEHFLAGHRPLLSTYLCFRDGFFTDVMSHGVAILIKKWPELGMVLVGTGDEAGVFRKQIEDLGLTEHVYLAGDLEHDAFLTLLSRSDVHLRTPITDGVSATVLEALSLRIPVVASENGTRPPGVITYQATDSQDLAVKLNHTLENLDDVVASIKPPAVADTTHSEIDLILGACRT